MARRLLLVAALVAVVVTTPARPAAAVTGGQEAAPGAWPWQVALLTDGALLCGGSLVALDLVLTAAHCTDDVDAADLTVVAGTIDLDQPGQRRDVVTAVPHEAYDSGEVVNDLALLRLAEPFEASDTVAPVALPDLPTSLRLAGGGAPVVVTGFGSTSEDGPASERLRQAEVRVVDDGTCVRHYAEEGDTVFGATQVCAGLDQGHVDACYGDSGGPLVVPADDEREAWYLVGVVSWGAGCGRPLRPTVYTEVAAFAPWLAEHGAIGIDGARFDSSGDPVRVPVIGTRGKAGGYPSTVEVDDFDGPLREVAVELHGLDHERPSDLDIWLEAPDGTVVPVLSDVGGDRPMRDAEVVVVAGAPAGGARPLALQVAPSDLDDDAQGPARRTRAGFDRLADVDPEGEWRLLVADDRRGAHGRLDGWTLVLR